MMTRQWFYSKLGPNCQRMIDRLRYQTGLLPRVNPEVSNGWTLPQPYRAALVISADFELAWGWQHVRTTGAARALALAKAAQARRNLPVLFDLFDLFDRYDVPVTWATVGHLFLESCNGNGAAHPEVRRLPYFENEYWQ